MELHTAAFSLRRSLAGPARGASNTDRHYVVHTVLYGFTDVCALTVTLSTAHGGYLLCDLYAAACVLGLHNVRHSACLTRLSWPCGPPA